MQPGCPEYTLLEAGIKADTPKLLEAMKLVGEPLPLLWTADFIPKVRRLTAWKQPGKLV